MHTPPGLLGLQSTCSPHLLGNPFAQCSVTVWGWWVNEWNQSMEPTQQLLGLLLQFQSIQGECKPTEKTRTQCLKVSVYSAERLMLKSLYVLSLKQVRLMFAKSIYPTQLCLLLFFSHLFVSRPQCLFMLVLCSDRQFPKGILNYSLKLSKSLSNYQQATQYIPLPWGCFLCQPSLLKQKTLQVYLCPFEGGQDD